MLRLFSVLFVALLSVAAGLAAQPARPPGSVRVESRLQWRTPQTASVAQLRAQKAAGAVAKVNPRPAGVQPPAALSPAIAAAAASVAYSQGNGVVLEAAHLLDETTGSGLYVRGVTLHSLMIEEIRAGKPNVPVNSLLTYNPGDVEKPRPGVQVMEFAKAWFGSLPGGSHTYLLSLACFAPVTSRIWVKVEGEWHHEDLVWNATRTEARLLLEIDSSKIMLPLLVQCAVQPASPPPVVTTQTFHHVQLARID